MGHPSNKRKINIAFKFLMPTLVFLQINNETSCLTPLLARATKKCRMCTKKYFVPFNSILLFLFNYIRFTYDRGTLKNISEFF